MVNTISYLCVCTTCISYSIVSHILIRLLLYRSDPTENDSVEGLRPNARGPGLVTFGVSFFFPFLFLPFFSIVCVQVFSKRLCLLQMVCFAHIVILSEGPTSKL